MSNDKAVAVTEKTVGEWVNTVGSALSEYSDRVDQSWLKTVMMCISDNDRLMQALGTQAGKKSLYHALRYAARIGISMNPQEGKCCLVPYKDEIQFQIMKNGLIELAMQSGRVKQLTTDTVRENDEFAVTRTSSGDEYRFSPARKSRGDIDGYFAAVTMTDGTTSVLYMSVDELKEHKAKYGQGLDKTYSAWNRSEEGMALKTVVKKLLRNLYISPEVSEAVGTDDKAEATPRDVTPEKGASSDDLGDAIEAKNEPAEEDPIPDEKDEPVVIGDKNSEDLF